MTFASIFFKWPQATSFRALWRVEHFATDIVTLYENRALALLLVLLQLHLVLLQQVSDRSLGSDFLIHTHYKAARRGDVGRGIDAQSVGFTGRQDETGI